MSQRSGTSVVLLCVVGLGLQLGCNRDKNDGSDTAIAGAGVTVHPPVGGQGTTLEVALDASSSVFTYTDTSADFGAGIVVDQVEVDDGWGARATITVEPDAALGARDVEISTGSQSFTVSSGFEVIAEAFTVDPDGGRIGQTLDITIVGQNTTWEGGVTWPTFGDDIVVNEFTVLSETLASANISITSEAAPGWRNVVMDDGGGDLVVLYDGFKVDRVSLAATFDPSEAEQGDTVEFTITARDTDFSAGTPAIQFFDSFGENPDVTIDSITVLDAENLYGLMTLSNAASLGDRDVLVTTADEGVLISDAFEVVGGDWHLEEVAIDLSFTVVRQKDNSSGGISEGVGASCTFYIPLDPACPEPGELDCLDGIDNDGDGYTDCHDEDCMGYIPYYSGSTADGEKDCNDDIDEDGDGFTDCYDTECLRTDSIANDPAPYDVNGRYANPPQPFGGGNAPEDCPYPTTIPAGDYVWLESEANTITMTKTYDSASGLVYYTAEGLTLDDYVTNNWYDLHTQGEDGGIGEYLLEAIQPTVPSDWEWTAPDLWNNYTHDKSEPFSFQWTPAGTYPDAIFVVGIFTENSPGPLDPEVFGEDGWSGYVVTYPWDDGEHEFSTTEIGQFAPGGVPVYAYSIISGPEFGLPDSIYQENTAYSYIYLDQYMVLE